MLNELYLKLKKRIFLCSGFEVGPTGVVDDPLSYGGPALILTHN